MRGNPLFKAYLALAAVCFFWGTTYLGIRIALESFPPFMLVGTRYLLSGSVLFAVAVFRGALLPSGRDLRNVCFSGFLILGVGNSALVIAELHVPSGLAGLITTISPFWMVGLEALLPGGRRLHGPTILGMLVGLCGAAILFAPDVAGQTLNRNILTGFLILQVGMASWSFGSIFQKRQGLKAHPVVVGAIHQLVAGASALFMSLVTSERAVVWNGRGVGALLYLALFGSIVGYSAYAYALDRLPVAVVSIHSYVNSIVAVALGWLFYREPFGLLEAAAMSIIFIGVALVRRGSLLVENLGAERPSGDAERGDHGEIKE